jgi:hypothetical protein
MLRSPLTGLLLLIYRGRIDATLLLVPEAEDHVAPTAPDGCGTSYKTAHWAGDCFCMNERSWI